MNLDAWAMMLALCGPLPEPPEAVLSRFPDCVTTSEVLRFNAAYTKDLHGLRSVYPHHWKAWGEEAWHESLWQYHVWDTLDWAHKTNDPAWKRKWLTELRTALGDDAYFAGRMPPQVPWWAFEDLDR